jgi:hypothetical protein
VHHGYVPLGASEYAAAAEALLEEVLKRIGPDAIEPSATVATIDDLASSAIEPWA